MKPDEFRRYREGVRDLTPKQRQELIQALMAEGAKAEVRQVIEKRAEQPLRCPHCGGEPCQRWGTAGVLQRYRCGACGKAFNALTGRRWRGSRIKAPG